MKLIRKQLLFKTHPIAFESKLIKFDNDLGYLDLKCTTTIVRTHLNIEVN